jgi:3',5'-cyclic AMP phosphodiesterase CpdA
MRGGVAASTLLGAEAAAATRDLTFVQISDSHIGFHRPENPDVAGTLRQTISKIRALPRQPDFVVHTGDITHLSTPEQFDNAQQILSELNLPIHFVPGEHDTQDEGNGREFLSRFGAHTRGDGWYSFDQSGVHFIALVNVVHLNPGGFGGLGPEQIAWIHDDVAHLRSSTPIVVFAHMPMWSLYPQWGWGTQDADAALEPLRRFGSVTVLNGHVHQIQQHVEGNISFHTAHPTAYPQPAPGAAASPGPMLVPADQLPSYLGLRTLSVRRGASPLAITESTLA